MKKFVLTVLAVAVAASPAFAQVGDISIYSDGAGTSCNVTDAAPGVVNLFVIHKHTIGATASQWALLLNGGSTLSHLSTAPAPGMLMLGTPPTDVSIAYGGCVVGDFLIANVTYFGSGTSPACSFISFGPAPTSPVDPDQIVLIECDFETVSVVPTGRANINPDGTCQCDVATETRTWGGVKALYR